MRDMVKRIRKYLSIRKYLQVMAIALFAGILTAIAVTDYEISEAAKTSTGSTGTTTVSSITQTGNNKVYSDYQGAYFYILPVTDFSMPEEYYRGTLYSTGQKDSNGNTITFRDIYYSETDLNGYMTWGRQYAYYKEIGTSSVPSQISSALMFVPYEVYNGDTLKSGWKNNISAICYYDADGGTVDKRYKITTKDKYLNNRIFSEKYNESKFNSYCKSGIFYNKLATWTADKDKELTTADAGIDGLRKKLGSKSAIKKFVKKNAKLRAKAYSLWCYILDLESSGSTLTFSASDKILEFIQEGYNNSYAARNKTYNKSSNKTGMGLTSGLDGKYKLTKWSGNEVNAAPFKSNIFAQREYNLHVLDLMLCAYAAAVEQGASSEVQNAWLNAIYKYINNDDSTSAFPIAICGGTIARGLDQSAKGTSKERIVYVGTQDLVNFAMLLENSGDPNATSTSTSEKGNLRSITKSFFGELVGGSAKGSTYLLGIQKGDKWVTTVNKEVFAYGKTAAKKKSDARFKSSYTYTTIKKMPSYYSSYYKRMYYAVTGGTGEDQGSVKNLTATSAAEKVSWHSEVVLRAVVNKYYTRTKSGKVKEYTPQSFAHEVIQLVKQININKKNVTSGFKQRYGAMFIPSYLWPERESDSENPDFGVVLTIRSSLYAQGLSGNTTATYDAVDFFSPVAQTSSDKKNGTWIENADNLNYRRDFILSTRELTDNDTTAEAFTSNKETVQLMAQVTYPTKADKKKFKAWYKTVSKDALKVKIKVTPLYGESIKTSKKSSSTCQSSWNTSYTGTDAKSIGVTVDDGNGTKLKLLKSGGCEVSQDVFEAIFLPESGLTGAQLTFDTDAAFYKNAGFDVPQSKDGKKTYAVIGYQISITASGVKNDGSKTTLTVDSTSNKAGLRYSRTVKGDKNGENSLSYNYTSIPEDYSELKEGSVLNEQFEAMAGVPSTRSLYFSTGGSEFIVNLRCNYEANQKAERTYTSHFNSNDCEYKETDQLKEQKSKNTITETFVANNSDETQNKSVKAQVNKATDPKATGKITYNTTVNEHSSSTKFEATWTGTIKNNTNEPADIGTFYAGKAGSTCAGNNYDIGTQRSKDTAKTNWDTSGFNTAVSEAFAWAEAMEDTNDTYTVKRIADSDDQVRIYKVGTASIKVTITGGNTNYSHECGLSKSYSGGTYKLESSSASDVQIKNTDSAKLGSGYSWSDGTYGKGSGYSKGNHGHGGTCPGNDATVGTDADGKPIKGPCGSVHRCGSFTPGTDITHGKSDDFEYTITVTFTNGKVLSDGAYDDGDSLTSSTINVGSSLPAHALCGPCCTHVLPAIEDKWTQIVWFDTMTITDMQVWKLESGYVQGISEITQGNDYYDENETALSTINDSYDAGEEYVIEEDDDDEEDGIDNLDDGVDDEDEMVIKDRIFSEITQADPNIFYNIAAKNVDEGYGSYNTSAVGRLRYSLQTGQDDAVYYEEKNAKGELKRSNKCDGQSTTAEHTSKNPVSSGGKGHKQSWSKGCLYSNDTFINGVDYHKQITDSVKTKYNTNSTTLAKRTDEVDEETVEWKRFEARRNEKVTVTVISDFLILRTSSGDQSVLYYDMVSDTVTAQENFGEVDVDTNKSNAIGFAKMFTNNSLALKQGTAINIGSYNGNYSATQTKYKGSGSGTRIATAFDDDEKAYNNITDELGVAKVVAARSVRESSDENMASPGRSQKELSQVNGLVITKSNIIQCPTNINKEYTTGSSYAFYVPLIKYSDGGIRYTSSTLKDDNTLQETMRSEKEAPLRGYTKLSYSKKGYLDAGYSTEKIELLDDAIAQTGGISADDEAESRYLKALGKNYYGILLPSIYAKGKSKCNDIIVYDPVSTDQVRIMRLSSQTDDLDQRTAASYEDSGGAAILNDDAADEGTCPGIPGECNFRTLNCKYSQEIIRAAFSVDDYSKTLVGDEEEAEYTTEEEDDGEEDNDDQEDNTVYAESSYSYSIKSSVINDNGGYASVYVSGTGFDIRSESGDIPPESLEDIPSGTNYVLSGSGKASMPFLFSTMSIDSANTSERVQIAADITVNELSLMPVISTAHTQLFVNSDGTLLVKTDDGAEYKSLKSIISAGTPTRIALSLCFGTISDFSVTADGNTVSFSTTKSGEEYDDEVCGTKFYLGNNDSKTYDVNFTADNIAVTRLPGTTEHTQSCYTKENVHEMTLQNTYNGVTEDGDIDWEGEEDDGSDRTTSENNTHEHTDSCLDVNTEGYTIAYDKAVAGDTSYIRKMVGEELWNQIAKHFGLKQDENGDYLLSSEGVDNAILIDAGELSSGEYKEFSYTGNIQTISLDAGTYTLETWGAQGGSLSGYGTGGKGGYSKGTLELTKKTTLYIGVGAQGQLFNGGGQGYRYGCYGGGATHIATKTGELSTLSDYKTTDVLLVAGGGGGAQAGSGGSGGGANLSGTTGTGSYGSLGAAGTLTSGYAFGQGGPARTGNDGCYGGAGGGGYYGGYGSCSDISLVDDKGGAGGSGYANTTLLTDISGTTGANTGNGKAKITAVNVITSIDSAAYGVKEGDAYDYAYTGDVQEVTLPAGTYKLETWGASGGDDSMTGGNGGYAAGEISLNNVTTLYIGVGGKGTSSATGSGGGYNGGGNAGASGSSGGGGGATHIATEDGTLSSLKNNTDSVLLVAGGGGGGGNGTSGAGGTGGGAIGGANNAGQAANQTSGYAFGQGGACQASDGGGGGGGYYGGYGATGDMGGGGGSGYVGGVNDGTMTSGVWSGNGKARITVLSVKSTYAQAGDEFTFDYTGNYRKITLPAGTYKLETWGASGGGNAADSTTLGSRGGQGGYTSGELTLKKTTTLYVYVGGAGQSVNSWTAGGYNGGGGAGYSGNALGTGGGATDFRLTGGTWSDTTSLKSRILVAGGGGGSDDTGSTSGSYHAKLSGTYSTPGKNDNDESGGAGGALSGEGAVTTGYEANYGGGTQSSGGTAASGGVSGSFGTGGGTTNSGDYGGGGGGYYGGASGGGYFQGGAGGSSYVSGYEGCDTTYLSYQGGVKFKNVTMQRGGNTGNGKAKITVVSIGTIDKDELFEYIKENSDLLSDTITTNGYSIINPIWDCKCKFDKHTCTNECGTRTVISCKEPHHSGSHYDYSSKVCYDACNRDENHKQYQTEVTDERGNILRADNFILLDNYFDVYYPNKGSFYETSNFGILDTQSARGMGYTTLMDTTEWTREKWIKFPYSVLYNRNGTWEEHEENEWFKLEIFDEDGNTLDTYHFYCQLKNDELGSAEVEYAVEAINHETYPGETEEMTSTSYYNERHLESIYPYEEDEEMTVYGPTDGTASSNTERHGDSGDKKYWSYEDCFNITYIDVVGRIGNLLIDDTDDLRFSNFFKKTTDDGWLIDGVLKTVDQSRQNNYMSWWGNDGTSGVDIRGEKVTKEIEWYNTYQTQNWTNEATSVAFPIQAKKNTVSSLRNSANELRLGYDVLWEVSTIGNYANGTLQVIPYYYALNINTGEITPVDVYIDNGSDVSAVNYFGLFDAAADGSGQTAEPVDFTELVNKLYSYNMTLNWTQEKDRRNYGTIEKEHTESLSEDSTYGSFAYDTNGDLVTRPVTTYNEEDGTYSESETTLVYNLTTPYGDVDYVLGNAQLLYVDCEPTADGDDGGRARTFIGSSTVTALLDDINGSNETNLLSTDAKQYWVKGQRWHLTLGLPSTSKFVAYRGTHVSPNSTIEKDGKTIYASEEFAADANGNCDYVILMTADIKGLGDVYNLSYSGGFDNGVFRATNGNVFKFGDDIPTVLAVYGIGDTNTPDLDIMQTH